MRSLVDILSGPPKNHKPSHEYLNLIKESTPGTRNHIHITSLDIFEWENSSAGVDSNNQRS